MIQLETAIALTRSLEKVAQKHGCHVGLTGGTLFNGSSQKDVDVLVYPSKTLNGFNFSGFRNDVSTEWEERTGYHEEDEKAVWSTIIKGKRVDFIFVK